MDFHFKIQISYLRVLGQVIKQSLRHQELTATYTMETLLPQLIHYYQLECTLYLYLMIFHLRPYPLLFFSELTVQVNTLKYLYRITRIKFAILVHNCKYTIQNTWTQLQVHDYRQTIPPSPHATLTAIVLWVATLAVSFISARRFTAYRWKRSFMHVMTLRVLFYYPVYSLLNVFGKVLDRADLNYVRLQTVHNQGLQCCIAITILILII